MWLISSKAICIALLSVDLYVVQLWPLSSTCYGAEKVYMITETELELVQNTLSKALASNEKSQQKSLELESQLKSSIALSRQLQAQLEKSEALSKQQQATLEKVNESFKEYMTEVKRKESVLKRQRDWAQGAIALGVIAGILIGKR